MADRKPFSDGGGREYGRVALVLCCVVALVLSASLVPALAGDAPADSLVLLEGDGPDGSTQRGSGGAAGLGALNVGDETDVGGALATDDSSLRSLSPAVHFTVQSTSGSYWRTGSYDRYTGTGWEQTGEVRPTDGDVDVAGVGDREVRYEVRLNQSATSVPTVWMPQTLTAEGANLVVTDGGALRVEEPLSAGTTYTGTSLRPPSDPAVLRASGRDYPADVAARYTLLPDATPERVTTFTDDLTAGARSPYEEAVRIERWLETNKTYSLDASHDERLDVADQFIFEMDAGYCEYFATTMTVMLRSQGIPARYVVGYSTGQATGENAYTVRGMNAHAWVEVYFPDVGWVQFDPTPGAERLDAEQQAFAAANEPGSYNQTEEGSPGEQFSPTDGSESTTPERHTDDGSPSGDGATGSESTPDETATGGGTTGSGDAGDTGDAGDSGDAGDTGDAGDSGDAGDTGDAGGSDDQTAEEGDQPSGYAIALNTTPVPGGSVNVTVTNDGTAAEGVTVFFNDAPVGRTDVHGSVVATVPYTTTLTVSIGAADVERRASLGPVPTLGGDRRYTLSTGASPVFQQENRSNGSSPSQSYRLDTNASLSFSGERVTNNEVLLTASVRGVPVRDASVTLDGDPVARTDRAGRARVPLPADPGNVTVAVRRGAVRGEATLSLPGLRLGLDPVPPLALPLQPIVVQATLDDQSLAGANVTVAGESVGQTGVDGTLRHRLPLSDSVTVSVEKYGQTQQTTVSGLYTNALLVGLPPVLLLGAAVVTAARQGVTPGSVLRSLVVFAGRLVQYVLTLLVGAASLVDRLLRRAVAVVARAVATVRSLLAQRRTLSEVLADLRSWLAASLTAARTQVEATTQRYVSSAGASTEADVETDPDYRTVREAWTRLLSFVTLPRLRTKTPGEIADHAVDVDGLPAEAVDALVDVFQSVEYGDRDPSQRLARVEEAIAAIEAAVATQRAHDTGDAVSTADEGQSAPDAEVTDR